MRLVARLALCAVSLAAALAPQSPSAEGAEATLRIAVVVPGGAAETVAAEVSAGIALAVAASNEARTAGAKRPTVEVVQFDAGDAAIAALAVDKAAKDKCLAAIALAADGVAANLEVVARKAKFPLVLVGPGGSMRTLDAADPVLRVDPSPADRALAIAELLRLRSGRSSIGLPAQTKRAWLVVEDAPWARAAAASLRADDVDGLVAPGEVLVKTGEEPDAAATSKARADGCDRVVVLGGTRMLRAAFSALDKAAWDVPVVALDAALDGVPVATKEGARRKIAFVAATPVWIDERHVDDVLARHPLPGGRTQLTPAAQRGFVAAAALIDAAVLGTKKSLVASLRDLREGSGAREWPLFDLTGCADHWRYGTWVTGDGGAVAPIKAAFLPDAALGPLLGGKPGARYRPLAGATCVRVGYGGGTGPEPTIDSDLATLGMGKKAGAAYDMVREQIVARTCGKLSRLWSKSYDGSPRPGLSFRIAFVPEGTDTAGASAVWDAAIAGDGPDGLHGGTSSPKDHRAQALSTFLLRNATLLHSARLAPPLAATDAAYLDGSYAWKSDADGNVRCDKIRALLDGCASTFCMKLSKEIGHLAGLSVDNSGEPRSVMVAKGGEGTSDEFAYFPPSFAKVLERTLGRVGAEGK
jgi:ABC-type branched-subunit amino acid transport system substrate-binding protein